MKQLFTLSALILSTGIFLTGCVKNTANTGVDEAYWLSKERGVVVYNDFFCNYYVVETFYGYTIIRAHGGYKPREGSVVYGNFSSGGTRNMYNRSAGFIFTGTVTDYRLSYRQAQDALDFYCPVFGGRGTATREFKQSGFHDNE